MLFFVTLIPLGFLLYGLYHFDAAHRWKLRHREAMDALQHERTLRVIEEAHSMKLCVIADAALEALEAFFKHPPTSSPQSLETIARLREELRNDRPAHRKY